MLQKHPVQGVVSTRGGTQNKFHMEVNLLWLGGRGRGVGELRYSVSKQFHNSGALSERAQCTSSPFPVQTIPQVSSQVSTQYKIECGITTQERGCWFFLARTV